MKGLLKNKIVTVLIVISTIVLAGIAIFTATRLYQLRDESISPAAPESTPAAALPACHELGGGPCKPGSPMTCCTESGLICVEDLCRKTCNDSTSCPMGQLCKEGVCLPEVSGQISCNDSSACPAGQICKESMCVSGSDSETVSCQLLTFTLSSSPTPTPTATPKPSPTPSPTPAPSCNDSCTTDIDCENGLSCISNHCRNASCPTVINCTCTVATPTPVPTNPPGTITPAPTATNPPAAASTPAPSLPDSGVSMPVLIGSVAGALLLIISLVLAL